ncbi:MAG: GNAT family N-acetyltransferase, partial [Oscillochloris sp.]|nr:GNAT family N-acetyltransferase [Oscillochloris sp.]
VEAFYARRGLPVRFQLNPSSQPVDLDAHLDARGYTVDSAITSVQVAAISTLVAHGSGVAEVREQPDAAWLAAYWASEGIADPRKQQAQQQMLARIGPPAGFATLLIDGEVAALALGVVERGWLGIFSVATVPAYRRRGLGTQALADLAIWAQHHGADHCYLQVMHANAPALALYRRLGFEPRYDYWYRVKWAN